MAHETPSLRFEHTAPIERIAPQGLTPDHVHALFAPYPANKIGRYVLREKKIQKHLTWAREASEHLIPTGESLVAAQMEGDKIAYTTSESVLSSLYALRPSFAVQKQEELRIDQIARSAISRTAFRAIMAQQEAANQLRVDVYGLDVDEKLRTQAADALAELHHDFNETSEHVYLRGLPSSVLFFYSNRADVQFNAVDLHNQFFDYLGEETLLKEEEAMSAPRLLTSKMLLKLIPLITRSEQPESGLVLLDELSKLTRENVSERALYREQGVTSLDDIELSKQRSADLLQRLVFRGYAQYIRSFPARISLPNDAFQGVAPEHRTNFGSSPEEY